MMSSGVSCSMLRSLTKKHSQLSKNTLRTLRAHFYTLLSGVSCVLRSFILRQQKKTARPSMFRHFVPSRELHSLATLVRLSLVDLPSANSIKCCSPPASLKANKMNFMEQANQNL